MNTTSWIVGFAVGGAIVVVVVIVALTIIKLATDIRDTAGRIVGELHRAKGATDPLWEVRATNQVAGDALIAARRAGDLLGGPEGGSR